ncbi:YggT family protein [Teredinibacter sp. KSP-S5-2]|uniref:YggT family protein n=1 Tax=Teredinibacter sp. KSP-S5-2 TaxID=3034506 RepID=UPI0029350C75|nr:YggT family protein [Teredinibacter sp. KSP-S5-2]WNO09347.1 YggT family protein [Teredinibacter sp. KSP-S5-2]
MTTISAILIYLLQTLTTLFLLFVILRFMLQIARADFYNPFSQAVVKVTNPLLIPMRRIIPGIFGIDIASIILALVIQVLFGTLYYFITQNGIMNPGILLIWGIIATLNYTRLICIVCLFIVVISSFVAPFSHHPILTLVRQLMQPLIQPFQRIIPPMGGLDFSVLFVFIALGVVQIILVSLAQTTGLDTKAVVGFF